MLNELNEKGCCQEDRFRQVGLQQRPSLHLPGLHRHHQILCTKAGNDNSTRLVALFLLLVWYVMKQKQPWHGMQLESLKKVLRKFYGDDPLRSPDLSRIVNSNHFNRLRALMDEDTVAAKIAFGGQSDEQQL